MQIARVLVPTDFSSDATQALQRAVGLARVLRAEIHLLHAYQLPLPIGGPEPLPLPQVYFDRIRSTAREELGRLKDKVAAEGVTVASTVIVHDVAWRAIIDTAREIRADLIVMGTRGLTGLKHALLGSVAERVVRLAPCDVLTVKVASDTSA